MRKGDVKVCTEALVLQEQALRTNHIKYHIGNTIDLPLCRLHSKEGEIVSHIRSQCGKLAQQEYTGRHDNVYEVCTLTVM